MTPDNSPRTIEPNEPHGHSEPAPHHAVNYQMIFVTLIVLTVLTVVVAFVNLRTELSKVLVALTIASIKATFVARFFMHVKFEGKLVRLILFCPLFLCVVLIVSLIPDVGRGQDVAINDMVHWYEHGEPRDTSTMSGETHRAGTGGATIHPTSGPTTLPVTTGPEGAK